jgi:hypothetical protein
MQLKYLESFGRHETKPEIRECCYVNCIDTVQWLAYLNMLMNPQIVQGDSLARDPTEVYLHIFNEFVN